MLIRPFLTCGFLLLLTANSSAAAGVRIVEVGLQGYHRAEPTTTRVRVEVLNPESSTQNAELRLSVRELSTQSSGARRVNTFITQITLAPGERRVLDVPVLVFRAYKPVLEAELVDASGRQLGHDARPLEPPEWDRLIALVCQPEAACQAAQTKISFSGSAEEQTRKGKLLRFAVVREQPVTWWGYAPADVVLLAAPTREMNAEERDALEEYLRQGGRLILVEDAVKDATFLAAYRGAAPAPRERAVGHGKLYIVPQVAGPELGQIFSGGLLQRWLEVVYPRYRRDELSWARKRLATLFVFPGLGWLLGWLAAYALLVGVLGFAVLRRLRRAEWAWVTMPALALVFAVAMYAASAAKRPKNFGVDEVAIYWMDDRSPRAAAEVSVRVLSPKRSEVTLSVPGEALFAGRQEELRLMTIIGTGIGAEKDPRSWTVRMGPRQEFNLRLLQWSFQDLQFHGSHRLAGTVRRTMPAKLRNETGLTFTEAMYVDAEKVYFLGAMAPGAEMDLSKAKQEPLAQHTGRFTFFWGYPTNLAEPTEEETEHRYQQRDPEQTMRHMEEWRRLPDEPFALVEMIRGWPRDNVRAFETRAGIFFGLAQETALGGDLVGRSADKKGFALVVVSMGKEP